MDVLVKLPPSEPGGAVREALDVLNGLIGAVETVPSIAVHSTDQAGIVRYWNSACADLYGIAAQDAVGQPFTSLVTHIDEGHVFDQVVRAIWAEQMALPSHEWHVQRPDGRRLWVHSTHFPVGRKGHVERLFSMELDVSLRKQTEHALQMTAQVFENSRDAILIIDREHHIVGANPAFAVITGYPRDEMLGAALTRLRSGLHEAALYKEIWQHVARHEHWSGELWCGRKDGSSFPAWVSLTAIRDGGGGMTHAMVVLADITDRKRAEAATRHQAEHDFLTGLPNRALFLDRLQHGIDSARRQRGRMALMYLDLDRFKGINDTFGHAAGDAVLKEVAHRLVHCVRKVDTVSRQGGDEFIVILADSGGVDQAAHVAQSVTHAVAQPVQFESHSISLSVSIGIAIYPDDGRDIETLLRNADTAMFHAKQSGRNAFRFFDPEMNAQVNEREQLLSDLRMAIQQGHFEIEYLPEVDMSSGRVTGLEALLRWRHPQRGLLLPHSFMRVAEDGGLMVDIGRWVLEQACQHARQWQLRGAPVVVAVNLSTTQFQSPGLIASVVEALRRSGLPPAMLELEVREEVLLKNDPASLAAVQGLRALGVQLTMDNFGTGYSSLSSLRRFPFSKLKIDRSFVSGIANGDGGLIPAIIACARSLRLRVSAEGVETAEQLAYLRELGCDVYLGRLSAQALNSSDPGPGPGPGPGPTAS